MSLGRPSGVPAKRDGDLSLHVEAAIVVEAVAAVPEAVADEHEPGGELARLRRYAGPKRGILALARARPACRRWSGSAAAAARKRRGGTAPAETSRPFRLPARARSPGTATRHSRRRWHSRAIPYRGLRDCRRPGIRRRRGRAGRYPARPARRRLGRRRATAISKQGGGKQAHRAAPESSALTAAQRPRANRAGAAAPVPRTRRSSKGSPPGLPIGAHGTMRPPLSSICQSPGTFMTITISSAFDAGNIRVVGAARRHDRPRDRQGSYERFPPVVPLPPGRRRRPRSHAADHQLRQLRLSRRLARL